MFDTLGNVLSIPTKIKFGAGLIKDLGTNVVPYGKKAMLLHDPFLKGSDLVKEIVADLKTNGIDCVIFDDVSPNPRNTVIDTAVDLCVKENCDMVIGIGGGSAIDSAKAIAIVAKNGGKCWEYVRTANGCREPEKGKLPMIAVPTTAGTGTEATPFSVINNPSLGFKATICDDLACPTISIVDPELMVTMPPSVTALTGIDAFAHSFEAYTSSVESPLMEVVALESMRLFINNIERAVENGHDIEARSNMALCSTYGGMAIAHMCTTMPHALGQALGGITDAPHGGTIATCINKVIEWTLPQGEAKFAKVAELFDESIKGLSNAEKAAKLPGYIEKLFTKIMGGKPITMSSYGMTEENLPKLVDLVMDFYYGDALLNPKQPTKEDVYEVAKASL